MSSSLDYGRVNGIAIRNFVLHFRARGRYLSLGRETAFGDQGLIKTEGS